MKPIPVWILKDNKVTNHKNRYNWAEPHPHTAQNSLAKSYPTLSCERFQSLLLFNFHYFLSFLGAMQFSGTKTLRLLLRKSSNSHRKCVHSCCLLLYLQRRLVSHEHVLLTVVEVSKILTAALKAALLERKKGLFTIPQSTTGEEFIKK